MINKIFISLLCLGIMTSACSRTSHYALGEIYNSTPTSSARKSSVNQAELLRLVNAVREKGCTCGTKKMPPTTPLRWNNILEDAAQDQSDYMASQRKISHTGRNQSSVAQRLQARHYDFINYGENVAVGVSTEAQVIALWLKSPGHCENIMGAFEEMGIARKGAYWTQVFGAPRPEDNIRRRFN